MSNRHTENKSKDLKAPPKASVSKGARRSHAERKGLASGALAEGGALPFVPDPWKDLQGYRLFIKKCLFGLFKAHDPIEFTLSHPDPIWISPIEFHNPRYPLTVKIVFRQEREKKPK